MWRPPGVAGVRAEASAAAAAADGAATVSGSALHQQRAHRDPVLPALGFIRAALFWKLAAGDGTERGVGDELSTRTTMLYSWIPAVWIPAAALLFGFQGKGRFFHSLLSCAGDGETAGLSGGEPQPPSTGFIPLTRGVEVCDVTETQQSARREAEDQCADVLSCAAECTCNMWGVRACVYFQYSLSISLFLFFLSLVAQQIP